VPEDTARKLADPQHWRSAKGHIPVDLDGPQTPQGCLDTPVPGVGLMVQGQYVQGVSIHSHGVHA
jgi:hypothetical protein